MSYDVTPRIYIACLAAYNNGFLHGRWIDATQEENQIYQEINTILADSPIPGAEEWAIHDYEGFESIIISESEGVASVCQHAQFIQAHGALGGAVAGYYGDLESAEEALENHYHGEWESEVDFANEIFDECYAHNLTDHLKFYIDYEKFSRDLFINDYLSLEVGGKTHVFSHH